MIKEQAHSRPFEFTQPLIACCVQLTSRARSIKALGESRASERMSKGERVHGITGVLIEWGMDEYRLIETVTERLRTVNDAIRYRSLALKWDTHGVSLGGFTE